MAIKHAKPWGLVTPGRPPTPSEGHAQSYARIGPEVSQRQITFDNGTCLRFGPEDPVDEFGPLHPFDNQVAQIDAAIRDCQSVTFRYQGATDDDDNRIYNGFRTNQPLNTSQSVRVQLPCGPDHHVYLQVPSKLASVGTLVSVYSTANKSDVCGTKHPGLSVDTRFGVLGRPVGSSVQDLIHRETDKERDGPVRERDEMAQQTHQLQGALGQQHGYQQSNQANGQHRRYQTRRGRRAPKDNQSSEQRHQQPNNQGGARMQNGHQFSNVHPQNIQQEIGQRNEYQLQNGSVHTGNDNHDYQSSQRQNVAQSSFQQPMMNPSTSNSKLQNGDLQMVMLRNQIPAQLGFQPQSNRPQLKGSAQNQQQFSPERCGEKLLSKNLLPPPLGNINYDGIPTEQIPQHLANTIMANAQQAGVHGSFEARIPESNKNTQSVDRHNHQNARRGDEELARYADELNQQPPNPAIGGLRGDTFVGEPVLRLQPATPYPNVLAAIAEHRDLQQRAVEQNKQQALVSHSIPMSSQQSSSSKYLAFDPNLGQSTMSNGSGGIGDGSFYLDQYARTARSRAADERRANAGFSISRGRLANPRSMIQLNSAMLAPSGPLSREPSPMPPRNRRLFDTSTRSSPVDPLYLRSQHRSASTGHSAQRR